MKKAKLVPALPPILGGAGGSSAAIVPYPINLGRNAPIPEDTF